MTFALDPEPEIVLGPPGTGKTTELLRILREELARGTPPDRVGLVTFTRRAAEEAQDRVAAEFKLTRKDVPHFRTLHSTCMRAVGASKDQVLQGARLTEFADWVGEQIEGRVSADGTWAGYARGDRLLFMEGLARITCTSLREVYERDHDDLDWAVVDRFARALAEYKRAHGLVDFTDMLSMFAKRGGGPRLDVLLGDEVQDFSQLQWRAFARLGAGSRRVVVAGDDDQAIFQWAGADADTLVDLPGRATVLGQSYRVPRRVQALAVGVVGRVHRRRSKTWAPRAAEGEVVRLAEFESADFTGPSTMVLARNRHQLAAVERHLRQLGVLYERENGPSVARRIVEGIVTWERLRRGEPQPAGAVVAGPYELMTVGVGIRRGHKKLPGLAAAEPVSLDDLKARGGLLRDEVWSTALDRIPAEDRAYLVRCRKNGERLTRPPRVRISTIHGAKGGEADRVVLLTDMAPRTWRATQVEPEAEHRVWYVGATRAKEQLCIVAPITPRHYDL